MVNNVSLLITAHHEQENLKKTIQSIMSALNQSHLESYEILIHLDNADVATAEVTTQYQKNINQIKIFSNDFRDPGKSRNFLISKAQYEMVQIWDGDDLMSKNYFQNLININPEARQVYFPEFEIYFGKNFNLVSRRKKNFLNNLITSNSNTALILAPKSLLLENPYPEESERGYEDWDLNLRLKFQGIKFKKLNSAIAFIRQSPGSRNDKANKQNLKPHNSVFLNKDNFLKLTKNEWVNIRLFHNPKIFKSPVFIRLIKIINIVFNYKFIGPLKLIDIYWQILQIIKIENNVFKDGNFYKLFFWKRGEMKYNLGGFYYNLYLLSGIDIGFTKNILGHFGYNILNGRIRDLK